MLEASRDEFHSRRKKGIGSSDAATLLGVSPWKNIYQLWEEKTSDEPAEHKDNWAMARGRELEPVARDIYEIEYGVKMPAKFSIHKRFDYMIANLDGFNEELNYGIEIKCPGKVDLMLAESGSVPDKYMPQIQWQMMVTGAVEWHYVSYNGKSDLKVIEVNEDKKMQRELTKKARWFWFHVRHKTKVVLDGYGFSKSKKD